MLNEDLAKQLVQLKNGLENSQDEIHSKCTELKRLVKTRYDQVLTEINHMNEALNTQIDKCEHEWIESLKHLDKSKLNEIKTEVDNLQMNKDQIETVTQKLNIVLYGSKLVEFKANIAKLDIDYLGSLVINESINYNTLKKFNIDDQLNDFADNIFFVTNPNGSFFIAYQNESNKLIIVTFDPISNKTDKKAICNCKTLYGINKSKKFIAFHLIMELDYDSVLITDTNFKTINEKRMPKMNLLGANDSYLYFGVESKKNQKTEPFKIFDWKLNPVDLRQRFQSKDENAPFFISEFLDQIDNRNGKYVLLYDNKLCIVNDQTGLILKSIAIETMYFVINSDNNIIVYEETNKRLCFYDLDGLLVKHIQLDNFIESFGFNMNFNDQLNFYDWNSNVICYS